MAVHLLHERRSSELHVRLFWNSRTDGVFIEVLDLETGDYFLVSPDPVDALEAFHHPHCFPSGELHLAA
jgi:hypothetical protein